MSINLSSPSAASPKAQAVQTESEPAATHSEAKSSSESPETTESTTATQANASLGDQLSEPETTTGTHVVTETGSVHSTIDLEPHRQPGESYFDVAERLAVDYFNRIRDAFNSSRS